MLTGKYEIASYLLAACFLTFCHNPYSLFKFKFLVDLSWIEFPI